MKTLFIKYKSVVKFILTFLGVYIFFSFLYKLYLDVSVGAVFFPDYVTHLVSVQTKDILNVIGYNTQVFPYRNEASLLMSINGRELARIIEGCNAISVIILFISFIIAFSGKLKITLFYLLWGSVLIYVVNLIRIVLLTLCLYHYPEQKEILHDVVFPVIIYGFVFLLWIFWVNRFSKLKIKNA